MSENMEEENPNRGKSVKRCIDCKYYPNNCGYWDRDRRDKNAGYVHETTQHNCPDFSKKVSE